MNVCDAVGNAVDTVNAPTVSAVNVCARAFDAVVEFALSLVEGMLTFSIALSVVLCVRLVVPLVTMLSSLSVAAADDSGGGGGGDCTVWLVVAVGFDVAITISVAFVVNISLNVVVSVTIVVAGVAEV